MVAAWDLQKCGRHISLGGQLSGYAASMNKYPDVNFQSDTVLCDTPGLSGLKYLEFSSYLADPDTGWMGIGLCTDRFIFMGGGSNDDGSSLGFVPGSVILYASGAGFLEGTFFGTGTGFNSIDCMRVAVDHSKRLIWINPDTPSSWTGGGDPAAGTGGFSFAQFGTGKAFFCAQFGGLGWLRANFGALPFKYTPPAGATPY